MGKKRPCGSRTGLKKARRSGQEKARGNETKMAARTSGKSAGLAAIEGYRRDACRQAGACLACAGRPLARE